MNFILTSQFLNAAALFQRFKDDFCFKLRCKFTSTLLAHGGNLRFYFLILTTRPVFGEHHTFEGGFNQIGFAIYDYRPKFKIAPFFLIRLDAVENIVQKHVFVLDKYKALAYSINIGIDYFTGVKEYEIRTESELFRTLNEIKGVYASTIDGYLRYYSGIDNLDKALNYEKLSLNRIFEPDRGIRSMIIARLNNNPNFESIVHDYYKWYLKEYSEDIEDGPTRIRETINYLNSI